MGSAENPQFLSYVLDDVPLLATLAKSHPELHIVTKSHPQFQDVQQGFNRCSASPLAVIQPHHEEDIVAAMKACSEQDLLMTIRGGGHDLQHRPAVHGAVVLDLRRLNAVRLESDASTSVMSHAIVGGGALGRKVVQTLEEKSMMTPTGWCPDVGYVGWAAGGGYGLQASFHGIGADQILGARIATPKGTIVDTDDDLDLLWAVRGAGLGNFGVVLELRVRVYPQPQVLGGFIVYPFTEAKAVLEQFNNMCEQGIPHRLAAELSITNEGPAAMICMYYHWTLDNTSEDAHQAQEYLEKYRNFGTILLDTVTQTTSSAIYRAMDAAMPAPAPQSVQSLTVAGLSSEVVDVLVANPPVLHSAIVIHNGHGKILGKDNNAIFNMRSHKHLVLCFSFRQGPDMTDAGEIAKGRAWPSVVHDQLRGKGLALARSYQNFTPNQYCDPVTMYGDQGVDRFRRLKEAYNPSKAFPASYPVIV